MIKGNKSETLANTDSLVGILQVTVPILNLIYLPYPPNFAVELRPFAVLRVSIRHAESTVASSAILIISNP